MVNFNIARGYFSIGQVKLHTETRSVNNMVTRSRSMRCNVDPSIGYVNHRFINWLRCIESNDVLMLTPVIHSITDVFLCMHLDTM